MLSLLERIRDWWWGHSTRQITPEGVRARVRRGASYLDDVDPEWYRHVDSETLELGDGGQCVLGQLHGEFRLGLGRSHLINVSSAPRASLSPVSYGFKCVEDVPDAWQAYDYELLNQAWEEAVRTRQESDQATDTYDLTEPSGDGVPEMPAEPVAVEGEGEPSL